MSDPRLGLEIIETARPRCPRCQGRLFIESLPEPYPGDVWCCLACGWLQDVEYREPAAYQRRRQGGKSRGVRL